MAINIGKFGIPDFFSKLLIVACVQIPSASSPCLSPFAKGFSFMTSPNIFVVKLPLF